MCGPRAGSCAGDSSDEHSRRHPNLWQSCRQRCSRYCQFAATISGRLRGAQPEFAQCFCLHANIEQPTGPARTQLSNPALGADESWVSKTDSAGNGFQRGLFAKCWNALSVGMGYESRRGCGTVPNKLSAASSDTRPGKLLSGAERNQQHDCCEFADKRCMPTSDQCRFQFTDRGDLLPV